MYSQTCASGHLCIVVTWLQQPLQFAPYNGIFFLIALCIAAASLQRPPFSLPRVADADMFDSTILNDEDDTSLSLYCFLHDAIHTGRAGYGFDNSDHISRYR